MGLMSTFGVFDSEIEQRKEKSYEIIRMFVPEGDIVYKSYKHFEEHGIFEYLFEIISQRDPLSVQVTQRNDHWSFGEKLEDHVYDLATSVYETDQTGEEMMHLVIKLLRERVPGATDIQYDGGGMAPQTGEQDENLYYRDQNKNWSVTFNHDPNKKELWMTRNISEYNESDDDLGEFE